jgi:hypothetical protein
MADENTTCHESRTTKKTVNVDLHVMTCSPSVYGKKVISTDARARKLRQATNSRVNTGMAEICLLYKPHKDRWHTHSVVDTSTQNQGRNRNLTILVPVVVHVSNL